MSTVKEHYNIHLGNFYSWYSGNVEKNKTDFLNFCKEAKIQAFNTKVAIDLGAGNGAQALALTELGYYVKAIDFNRQLIDECKRNCADVAVEVIEGDFTLFKKYSNPQPELIICCGDTIAHLDNLVTIKKLISNAAETLVKGGELLLSFRDYSIELEDTNRFIPVKSDSTRILTCYLEYFHDKVRVTDLLHEFENGIWVQKVSSYFKTRISKEIIINYLIDAGFEIRNEKIVNRMIYLTGKKN